MSIAIAALGMTLGGIRFLYDGYYEEPNKVIAQLKNINTIYDTKINGFNDVGYEVTNVRFKIAGRPDTLVVIQRPQKGMLGDVGHLWLERLGPWEFHYTTFGQNGVVEANSGKPVESLAYTNSIDIGTLGEFGSMLPVKIRDVNDLVANYDELVRYFTTWPDEQHWGRCDEPSGRRKAYCRMASPSKRPIPPPTDFPEAW
jgi:hypothetical protein